MRTIDAHFVLLLMATLTLFGALARADEDALATDFELGARIADGPALSASDPAACTLWLRTAAARPA